MKTFNDTSIVLGAIALALSLVGPMAAFAATTPSLGAAATYGVLSSTYTNTTAATMINGDVGFTTGPAVAPLGTHTNYGSGVPYATAGTNQDSALSSLALQPCTFSFAPGAINLSTDTTHGTAGVYVPGVYCSTGAMDIGGPLTLTGGGTYIFRPDGALTSTAHAIVTLNGASACDVFWTPTQATTLAANTTFAGIVIDNAGITVGANTIWNGMALAFGGTVTTDTAAVTVCSSSSPTPGSATLHVIKQVINNDGGTATASSFNLHVKLSGADVSGSPAAGAVSPGRSYSLSAGTYAVSEDANAAYARSFSGDCDASGNITLAAGDNKTCTITNNDIAGAITPPVSTGTTTATSTTSLTMSTGGTNPAPIIKAKWEMRECRGTETAKQVAYFNGKWYCEDDFSTAGAQIMPSGDDTVDTNMQICSVVTHQNLQDLDSFMVSADINYPNVKDYSGNPAKAFCKGLVNEIQMTKLTKADGVRMLCGDPAPNPSYAGISTYDPTLPWVAETNRSIYTNAEMCDELNQQEAAVFCGPITLSYEAPEGPYLVQVLANAPDGQQAQEHNTMTYLGVSAFKKDFTTVSYGNVGLNTFATVGGDLSMTTPLAPTVQGTGNTALRLSVMQDDMGFGQRLVGTTPTWNVQYKARLSNSPDWSDARTGFYNPYGLTASAYTPTTPTVAFPLLPNYLNLSQLQKMDFGVMVYKFPSLTHTSSTYSGNMTITASYQSLQVCP